MTWNEDTIEQAAISWFQELGFSFIHGPDIAPEGRDQERVDFSQVLLESRFARKIAELNPNVPTEAVEDAFRKVTVVDGSTLVARNRKFHRMLRDGVEVEYRQDDGSIVGDRVTLVDYENLDRNDWLIVNQFTVIEAGHNRRPDIVVFLNGLPIGVVELKNPGIDDATISAAYRQIQTYKHQIPSLFDYNELLVTSDGIKASLGSLTAGIEWFKPWKTIDGEDFEPKGMMELEVLIKGAFQKNFLLDLIQGFIAFEEDKDSDKVHKILAGYHQFHAAKKAVDATMEASRPKGDGRGGVVWHTQGSGKSFTMLFYAGQVVVHPEMNNPTLVVLTDRNDLDDQLFGQFARCHELLRQEPQQAESVENLRGLLKVASGGVVFTTIQKFLPDNRGEKFPLLTDRSNVVVIADEAHRSQYDMIDGLARNLRDALPNASFIGFTGTPIEQRDANTRVVFGEYVSIYDVERAVKDGATVPIYYESRIARLKLDEKLLEQLDQDFEQVTEGEEAQRKDKLKNKWSALEALVGDDDRVELIARDLVEHFDKRCEAMEGKGMVVCMSRRICVDLYNAIIKLRPDWADEKDESGSLKIIMTGSASDPVEWQQHIRTKDRRKKLTRTFKDPKSTFKLVIVRDMWLTGFDAPCLHTMYVDKPMRGHGLMQAIARVNRVFRDKPGGLIVDYIGLADQLKRALATYTESGGKGKPSVDTAEAVTAMLKHYELCSDMLHGFDWSNWAELNPAEKAQLLPAAEQFILEQEDGKNRFVAHVTNLSQAYVLCPTHEEAMKIRDDLAFFQWIRAAFRKYSDTDKSEAELDHAVRQLVSRAVTAEGEVIDIFAAAGLKKPDLSILSDEFLEEIKHLEHKDVAAELLKKLLQDEIKTRAPKNVVLSRSFSEMLKRTLNKYHNRAVTTLEIIEELISIAKEVRDANNRGDDLGLNDEELAFYDALAMNQSAIEAMGVDELKLIAAELVTQVRNSVTIDWTVRGSARARIRVMVRRILRKHGYPPDLQEEATKTVLEQAEALCADWAA